MNRQTHASCILFISLFAMTIVGCAREVTRANYDAIEIGMTEAQVQEILGPGETESSTGIAVPGVEATARVMRWQEGDRAITVTFVEGKVITKTQTGL